MTFKTRPHRYTIGLAPTSRARCRGCRRSIEKGALRLAIRAFVRPNRGTTFTRHLNPECVGTALAADMMRARLFPTAWVLIVGWSRGWSSVHGRRSRRRQGE
jgi:hypothetical protein